MQPWEISRAEWEAELERTGERQLYGKGWYGVKVAHEDAVRQAFRQGEPVPAGVLAEYPELARRLVRTVRVIRATN